MSAERDAGPHLHDRRLDPRRVHMSNYKCLFILHVCGSLIPGFLYWMDILYLVFGAQKKYLFLFT